MKDNPIRHDFRNLLNGERCVFPASINDPVSARIAEELGYEAAMLAGSTASLAVLGDPDHILLTLSELSEQTRRICRAGSVPLMVDADHGYGNALNARRTVEEIENAGAAGLSIEDTNLPRPFDSKRSAPLLSIEEGSGKMQAAVDARRDPSFVIAARTNAPRISSIDDTLERIEAYQETGVDALFLVGVTTREQLEAIRDRARLPIMLGGSGADLADRDFLSQCGVRFFVQGHQPIHAAMQAAYESLRLLRDGAEPASLEGLPERSLIDRVTRTGQFREWVDRFLEPS
ncbi:MAG: isocitrate lyase/PEP mutase family protein [Gammaproteobacteria bacterium]|nr:isocitrate lyase/PEP mutase family protein [Gammaproteobacteria bacterium]MYJ51692.1 isocitrate lyase/PEP mutase family protein [Gammaproteobacteria bacterium]